MDPNKHVDSEVIGLAGALLNLLWKRYAIDLHSIDSSQVHMPVPPGLADIRERLSNIKTADGDGTVSSLDCLQSDQLVHASQMTIATFVESKFMPEHVALMGASGRAYYKSMLKHVLRPEEVDQMFRGKRKGTRKRLKAVCGWPYLSTLQLCEVQSGHVAQLISAAKAQGYSLHTVNHIRCVVSAILSHAIQERCFVGDNPVSLVKRVEIRRKQNSSLDLERAKEALSRMRHPEREMTLLSIYSGMNLTEILGLQWRHVNLTEAEFGQDSLRVPPRTITVRTQLYRGNLECVKKGKVRNLPIEGPLLQMLVALKGRVKFTKPDDYIFVSRVGTPVNQNNLLARRLRPLAKQLGVPSLSCQAFRHLRNRLASEFARTSQDIPSLVWVSAPPIRDTSVDQQWHCRVRRERVDLPSDFAREAYCSA
jgi:integrase